MIIKQIYKKKKTYFNENETVFSTQVGVIDGTGEANCHPRVRTPGQDAMASYWPALDQV